METPRVLVVIPAYHESRRLPPLLADVAAHLGRPSAPFDVRYLIVDDGSGPSEARAVEALIAARGLEGRVSLLALPVNRGKGGAIAAGFRRGLETDADYLGFMDADGSVSIKSLYEAVEYMRARAGTPLAAVAGSRVHMLGRRISRSIIRHYVSRVFATFVSLYFRAEMYDSQCGLKLFRRDVLAKYLDAPTDFRWVWDTELVMAMLHGGELVHELPIDWTEVRDSRVSFLWDPLVMASHLIAFKRRLPGRPKAHGPA